MAHIELEIEGQIQKYEYEESVQGEVVYDINTNEVGIVTEANRRVFEQEVEWMDAFTPHMACFMKQEEDEAKEEDRKYLALATLIVYDEFNNASDDKVSSDIVNNLKVKINEKTDELKAKGPINTKAAKISDKVHSEILWAKGKRMVRVRSDKVKNHNRWFGKKQVQQQIEADNKKENKKNAKTIKSSEIKLLKKEFWSEEGTINETFEEINKDLRKDFFKDNNNINSSVEAKLLRYTTEAAAEAKLDWTDKKELKIGAKASGSFSVAEASGDFTIQMPDQYGFGLMQFLKNESPEFVEDDFTEIFLKVILSTTGSAFVGACASVSADLGLSCSKGNENAGVQAGIELFAGAKAQATVSFAIDTMFVSDDIMDKMRIETKTIGERKGEEVSSKKIEEKRLAKWETLSKATVGAYVAAGWGIDATFKFGYFDNKFRYQAKIGATVKLGAGTFLKGELDVKLAGKFVLTVAHGLNWTNISEILDDKAYNLYHTLMNNCFYVGEQIEDIYNEILADVSKIMDTILDLRDLPEKGLAHLKIVDDNWDENVPGYSSYKQYSLTFLVLKSTYSALKQRNEDLSEKEAAIALVEEAQKNKIRWNYATWQMKVNLIYAMRHDGSGMLGGLSEEDKEDAVIAVLDNARNSVEFKKIVDGVESPDKKYKREDVKIDDLLDFSQQDRFNQLKIENNY